MKKKISFLICVIHIFCSFCFSKENQLAKTEFNKKNEYKRPHDWAGLTWKEQIPRIIHPNKELEAVYLKTWDIAAGRVRKGPDGLVASPYLDENCYEDQIWIWDACFMVMFSKYAPDAYPGKETLSNFYAPIHDSTSSSLRIHFRDNPPLFAWVEYDNFFFTGDDKHIDRVLQEKKYLQKHYHYFQTVPKGDVNNALSPNSIHRDFVRDSNKQIIGYTWSGRASGMDNTPRGRDAGGDDKIMWIDAISQQALSALYLSRLCTQKGLLAEATKWDSVYNTTKKIINQYYWNEEDGFYYDVQVSDKKHSKIKTPASYWAMLAEIPSPEQAKRMVRYLRSHDYMGGEHPWNSLSRDDKDYNDVTGDYWKGGIWLPHAYMGIKALEKYGHYDLADELAERVVNKQIRTFYSVTPNTIWECYSPSLDQPSTENGRRARPDFCGWSALGPISMTIENILGFRYVDAINKEVSWWLKKKNRTHGIKNLHIKDIDTDILYDAKNNRIKVKSTGKYILRIYLEDGSEQQVEIKSGENLFPI